MNFGKYLNPNKQFKAIQRWKHPKGKRKHKKNQRERKEEYE